MKKSIILIALLGFLAGCGEKSIRGKGLALTVKDKFMTTTKEGRPHFFLVSSEPQIYEFDWQTTADYYKADIGKTYKIWLTDTNCIWDIGDEIKKP